MLIPTSSEFVALCRAQVELLTQGLGASLSVVYLTEEMADGTEAKLIPVVAYPESAAAWDDEHFLLPAAEATLPRLLAADASPAMPTQAALSPPFLAEDEVGSNPKQFHNEALQHQRQVVLPLMHEGMVMGLLVTERDDRAWSEQERSQIEQVAHTLALGCVLDQRSQWLEREQHQQRRLQAQQYNLFDTLLHQFRNPLTAMRTFGKLLLRRLSTGDPNRDVASSIVRESDRLQELLQQFDQAIDLGRADSTPLTLAPAQTDSSTPPNTAVPASSQFESSVDFAIDRSESSVNRASSIRSGPSVPLLPAAGFLTGANLKLEHCAIASILEPLVASASAIAQERELALYTHIPSDLPWVKANAKALREVLSNLLDNALKYTPAQGQVYVEVSTGWSVPLPRSHADWLGIAIWDTGPGIPPQDLAHLFERHYRGVQAQTGIPGTGLGLAIAHDLVQQMQGEIQVFSPAQQTSIVHFVRPLPVTVGPGTAFVVWLPLASTAKAA
ncbi:GAF domain-containing sensor histidine kinase [Trichocoleus desertorum AS-A10]|uniref:GAF domain-containing sensor histidine kinase n=1 Tax=Trichocoleus desertorum TaxID=1481672 RepID=UPI003297081E